MRSGCSGRRARDGRDARSSSSRSAPGRDLDPKRCDDCCVASTQRDIAGTLALVSSDQAAPERGRVAALARSRVERDARHAARRLERPPLRARADVERPRRPRRVADRAAQSAPERRRKARLPLPGRARRRVRRVAGMVGRCLERLDDDDIPGEVRVLRALSDTHPVGTQGPVWYVGGKTGLMADPVAVDGRRARVGRPRFRRRQGRRGGAGHRRARPRHLRRAQRAQGRRHPLAPEVRLRGPGRPDRRGHCAPRRSTKTHSTRSPNTCRPAAGSRARRTPAGCDRRFAARSRPRTSSRAGAPG